MIVVEVVTVTVEMVVTVDVATVSLTTIMRAGATAVEIVLTVVVEGLIERQEQAEEISDEAKAEIWERRGCLSLRSARFGEMVRSTGAEVML